MSIAIESLRSLCIRSLVELRVRVSMQDGPVADRMRGTDGEKLIARLVGIMLQELVGHAAEVAADARKSHTLAAVRKAVPRLRGE